jgi:hypothetical protein
MLTKDHDTARNLYKVELAGRLLREVFTQYPSTLAQRNGVFGPMNDILADLRKQATLDDRKRFTACSNPTPGWKIQREKTASTVAR